MDRGTQTLRMTTPIGELELTAEAGELIEIRIGRLTADEHRTAGNERTAGDQPAAHGRWAAGTRRPHPTAGRTGHDASLSVLHEAQRQLHSYFAGKSDSFAVPTRRSGTEFQLAVWDALGEVGCGETITYGELAARVGRPNAARAVGQALARNPLPIVVPCHRVVGRLGELTGFVSGVDRKRLLLELERGSRVYVSSDASPPAVR